MSMDDPTQDPINLADIMAEHGTLHHCFGGMWHHLRDGECLPYRLAVLAQEQEAALGRVEAIASAGFPAYCNSYAAVAHLRAALAGEQGPSEQSTTGPAKYTL